MIDKITGEAQTNCMTTLNFVKEEAVCAVCPGLYNGAVLWSELHYRRDAVSTLYSTSLATSHTHIFHPIVKVSTLTTYIYN